MYICIYIISVYTYLSIYMHLSIIQSIQSSNTYIHLSNPNIHLIKDLTFIRTFYPVEPCPNCWGKCRRSLIIVIIIITVIIYIYIYIYTYTNISMYIYKHINSYTHTNMSKYTYTYLISGAFS
jgi:hypothetical protein